MSSDSLENYLKAIYQLQDATGTVTTTALAEALGVSAASATNMVKKLAALKLADHSPYRAVTLTRAGEKRALETIRHHRLIELFLAEMLGVPWDQVHAEAEKMEHVISEDLEARIAARLGNPAFDPHGDPIPSKAGQLPRRAQIPLNQLEIGKSAYIARVRDQDSEHLRYLALLGLTPGARVCVVAKAPFKEPLKIRVGASRREQLLSQELGATIFVSSSPTLRGARLSQKTKSLHSTLS